jgi:regulator of nucleoside diphosphate kinase
MSSSTSLTTPALRVSSLDHQRLSFMVKAALSGAGKGPETLLSLQKELERAEVVAPELLPENVVAMGSQVEIEDLESGEVDAYTLVFPDQADAAQGRLSIFAPIGTAILGFAEGDTFAWRTPGGTRKLRLRAVRRSHG